MASLSAHFTPCFAACYSDPDCATEHFMLQAVGLVLHEMYKPSLERTQGSCVLPALPSTAPPSDCPHFLLSVTECHGDRDRSFMHMGIAARMAGLLRLHREETYRLLPDASAEDVIASEVARRTFWMIASQDNLQSAMNTPAPFLLRNISALLPCDEQDFALGSALHAREPSRSNNSTLIGTPSRSLFAVLIQAHNLRGQVTHHAC
ncbi:hypothetical protein HETIRDRAFT_450741 [Heterobasidion irregulare TC 32-1]|uniref:Xylanolytic transcriptional activator regulatory domain-containing protein n=1 Tax=Heterobasidion irregulare (strain TC 32-1) TaxID=747525 RepID=W4KBE5_HETIT|nr:uncharacterized protein HETIRDRAFT_450741 [Heterobasidion irregulare TC 32-1]ETW83049.1 hypothetical protein HETIRDRAFT_450741 [Heterobasidion irregulare TC 32-1]